MKRTIKIFRADDVSQIRIRLLKGIEYKDVACFMIDTSTEVYIEMTPIDEIPELSIKGSKCK